MTPFKLRHRFAKAVVVWLLKHSGMGASMEVEMRESKELLDGMRRDHQAVADLAQGCAVQANRQAAITRGILLKHQAYEQASKPLMAAARRLNQKIKRAQKHADTPAAAEPSPPEGSGDATAAVEAGAE